MRKTTSLAHFSAFFEHQIRRILCEYHLFSTTYSSFQGKDSDNLNGALSLVSFIRKIARLGVFRERLHWEKRVLADNYELHSCLRRFHSWALS